MNHFWQGFEKRARTTDRVIDYAKLLAKKPHEVSSVINYSSGAPVVTALQKSTARIAPRTARISEAEKSLRRLANAKKGSTPESVWREA